MSAFESACRASGDCPVRCFCVDAEADGDACVTHGVLPGAATLIGFWRNEPVFFRQTAAAVADAQPVVTSDRRLLGAWFSFSRARYTHASLDNIFNSGNFHLHH